MLIIFDWCGFFLLGGGSAEALNEGLSPPARSWRLNKSRHCGPKQSSKQRLYFCAHTMGAKLERGFSVNFDLIVSSFKVAPVFFVSVCKFSPIPSRRIHLFASWNPSPPVPLVSRAASPPGDKVLKPESNYSFLKPLLSPLERVQPRRKGTGAPRRCALTGGRCGSCSTLGRLAEPKLTADKAERSVSERMWAVLVCRQKSRNLRGFPLFAGGVVWSLLPRWV